ncbi:MAG: hypothetical protein WD823_12175 [Sulfuricaulis sp.]|uniref:hypothetical protein n=1 Tax=Sulfuricaulis sp. TaxID=2003553 RepID=UPI0034A1DEB2
MTFAGLLLEIRQRAAALPDDDTRTAAIETIARDVLETISEDEQARQVRCIMAAFLGIGEGERFDAALLDEMTPELIFRLDMIAGELVELGRTNEAVRALRAALIRSVQ